MIDFDDFKSTTHGSTVQNTLNVIASILQLDLNQHFLGVFQIHFLS